MEIYTKIFTYAVCVVTRGYYKRYIYVYKGVTSSNIPVFCVFIYVYMDRVHFERIELIKKKEKLNFTMQKFDFHKKITEFQFIDSVD